MQVARKAESFVGVIIPVLNEAHVLADSVVRVQRFVRNLTDYRCRIVIVDNGSTDGTGRVARELASEHRDVDYLHLDHKGRGRALRYAWQSSDADIMCYMDVDLSTDLEELPRLLGAIRDDGYDIAIGSRLMRESVTTRSTSREIISRGYNLILKVVLRNSFSDAQCGFKAVSMEVVDCIVPRVQDQSWFFDTELLVLAERAGYRIKEIPVVWAEDDDSRVNVVRTGWDDLKGIFRLRWHFWRHSVLRERTYARSRQHGVAIEDDPSEPQGG
jgi:glycosyltransferase involved in cell wall biosynthesis